MAKRYQKEISHFGLNKHRLITGTDQFMVERKAKLQLAEWDATWARQQDALMKRDQENKARQLKQQTRSQQEMEKQAHLESANQATDDAKAAIEKIENLLAAALRVTHRIDWDYLQDHSKFSIPKPVPPVVERAPTLQDDAYKPKLGFIGVLFGSRAQEIRAKAEQQFKQDYANWEKRKNNADQIHQSALSKWEQEEKAFYGVQEVANTHIGKRKSDYLAKAPEAISDYCEMVLAKSKYPNTFPTEYELEYMPDTQTLVVDYQLPALEALPSVKEVKYVTARGEFKETRLSDSELNRLYDSALYQCTLRTLYELFDSDQINALTSIVFNGWVRSIDKATGQERTACVLSVQTSKTVFLEINLSQVDPKLCFKNLRGVGSSKLHSLTPIAPLVRIDREDSRFVDAYDVLYRVDDTTNIAAIDWEDFEHLIRELFEKEFAQSGGEVKITQASRDRGVDAIAFDPDPIRGGKIVIQAKRYTNTVGVSAVRDLYGTVLNEGATKGILVSTSDYGPDAHEFAKGKPLTLLSGANLLHLLSKHGYKAKIDLQEARRLYAEQQRN